jgi:hypothetical protein
VSRREDRKRRTKVLKGPQDRRGRSGHQWTWTDGASPKARHTRRVTTARWCRRRYCLDFIFYRRLPDGRGGGTREAVPVHAVENPSPGQGLRESARLEPLKGGNRKQGGFKCGTTVPGRREITRPGGDMERSVVKRSEEANQPYRKSRILDRITELEVAYGEYRYKLS